MTELRAKLLQRIHDNLDDDHARSVYADHLLACGGDDAWHGELIRLQLDGVHQRPTKQLRTRQARALGALGTLFEVTWSRGFPERLRTRRWSRPHVAAVLGSAHLPTIRAIEIGYMTAELFPALLEAAPALTHRITELNACSLTPALLDRLIAATPRFPQLRRLGLAMEPMSERAGSRLGPAALVTVFESALGAQLVAVQKAILAGQLGRYAATLAHAPRAVQQVELLSINQAGDADAATVYTRTSGKAFVVDPDPLVGMVAMLRADGDGGFESETRAWTQAQLLELAARLASEGLSAEATTVDAIAARRT